MKRLFTLLLIVSYSLLSIAQINVGNNQNICLGDTAQVIALLQGGSQGAGMDTVIAGLHASNYTSANSTRGWWFQAQSSFTISSIMSSEDNTAGISATNQSVEIVDFGTTPPGVYPNPGPHTVLFSSIGSSLGWISCNVNLVAKFFCIIESSIWVPSDLGSNAMLTPVPKTPLEPVPTQLVRINKVKKINTNLFFIF